MRTEFRRARVPDEIRGLLAFDRKVFAAPDRFTSAYWRHIESYWMFVDGVKAGCCAFERHVDFQGDQREDSGNPPMRGSLYIATTGILPEYQGCGLGTLLKAWQVAFARLHGFHRIVTNTRKRNSAMIHLNKKFRFRMIRTTSGYYRDPAEATVVMELRL